MKIVKTASGKTTVKMSKSEWTEMGKKAGWLSKEAAFSDDVAQIPDGKHLKRFKCRLDAIRDSTSQYGIKVILYIDGTKIEIPDTDTAVLEAVKYSGDRTMTFL